MRRFLAFSLLSIALLFWLAEFVYPSRLFNNANPDYADVSNSATGSLDIAGAVSVSAWVYITGGAGTVRTVFSKWEFGSDKGYALFVDETSRVHGRMGDGTGVIFDGFCGSLSLNAWHQVGMQYNATSKDITAVVDGVGGGGCVNHTGTTPVSTSNPALVGAFYTPTFPTKGFYMMGRMADVTVWNASLDTGEFIGLAAGTPANKVRPESLKGYWPLYGNPTEDDYSGNLHVLTLTGTTAANHCPCSKPGGATGPTH